MSKFQTLKNACSEVSKAKNFELAQQSRDTNLIGKLNSTKGTETVRSREINCVSRLSLEIVLAKTVIPAFKCACPKVQRLKSLNYVSNACRSRFPKLLFFVGKHNTCTNSIFTRLTI